MNAACNRFFCTVCFVLAVLFVQTQKLVQTPVLVIGGGTSGTAAGIQSARLGINTLIVEETSWLGGMISAAGVSAIDGNHRLPSGIWAEFRSHLYKVYGGPQQVETGWVSNTQFEPHVADSIFKIMAGAEKSLTVLFNCRFVSVNVSGNKIVSARFFNIKTRQFFTVVADIFIDATELGDVVASAKVPYSLGMEAGSLTGEKVGVSQSNDIVQDLTYVATLKDYGPNADCTIVKPSKYNPSEFDASNTNFYFNKKRKAPSVDALKMLEYGKLPNNKYMINWPIYGNDIYLNIIEKSPEQRDRELVKAKEQTLRFVYFIQKELGFKHLGLADDEFPTKDRLALMPYHRESRRVKGKVRLTMRHIAEPFTYGDPLYRTGIAVGDYPIDHHHKKNEKAPQHLEFYPIPSFNVPLGALIPQKIKNLIVAEKSISVSNVANGTTRLQPCVLLIGQAAGTLAAIAKKTGTAMERVPIRFVQQELLNAGAYIMPYIDIQPSNPHFQPIQKIGATGILKGTGIPYKWANQTWFYPDSLVKSAELLEGLQAFQKGSYQFNNVQVSWSTLKPVIESILLSLGEHEGITKLASVPDNWESWGLQDFNAQRPLTRLEAAVIIHNTIDPFNKKHINHSGKFLAKPFID